MRTAPFQYPVEGGIGRLAASANGDITIGDDTYETVVLADRQRASLNVPHGIGGHLKGVVGGADVNIHAHALSDIHGNLL
jgi:hypothetical protein